MTVNSNSTHQLGTSPSVVHYRLITVGFSLLSFIIITSVLWLVYFINYALLARRKVHYYQNISESYQISRLINTYMDFRRSQLICAILVFAILTYFCILGEIVFSLEGSNLYQNNCNLTFPLYNTLFRVLLLPSKYICEYTTLSLIVILTSYLSKAYSVTRVVVFRERNLFVWICIDAIIILLIHSTWFSFVLLYPFMTVLGLLKLILLAVYIRRMTNSIRINCKNAQLTESPQSTRQLKWTYRRYLFCSWGLFTFIAALITLQGVVWVFERARLFLTSPCALYLLFGDSYNNHRFYSKYIAIDEDIWSSLFQVCDIIEEILFFTLLLLLFTLHLGVFKLFIYKQLLQGMKCCRKTKRNPVRSTNVLVQPLLK